jgi:hypothetical protein
LLSSVRLAVGVWVALAVVTPPPLPSDAKAWIGAPQSWDALRGKVVLLDVWTFG